MALCGKVTSNKCLHALFEDFSVPKGDAGFSVMEVAFLAAICLCPGGTGPCRGGRDPKTETPNKPCLLCPCAQVKPWHARNP
jgi:hypothetical protein